jgi:YjbE family integral membrane protein
MLESILAAVAADPSLGSFADIWHHITRDFSNIGSPSALAAFGQVLMIDIMLAGDNAIVVGALAAGLPPVQRRRVIMIGIIAALVLRIGFALVVTQLMQIVGLILAGGLLLLWVSWKMWRELRHGFGESGGSPEMFGDEHSGLRPAKSFMGAAWAVAVADVSMSLDNVLAVAGAAREHPGILIIGLILSVALMGIAAIFIAQYIERYRWIAYVGLIVIVYVAGSMIYEGIVHHEVGILTLF